MMATRRNLIRPLNIPRATLLLARPLVRPFSPANHYSTQPRPPNADPNIARNALIATALLAAAGAAYYYETSSSSPSLSAVTSDPTFSVSIRTSQGVQDFSFPRISYAKTETMLRSNERSETVVRSGNPVVRWDSNFVASNEPCEDRSAESVIPRRDKGDLMLFSVLDGHAGWATSELLSKVLHPTLGISLAALQGGYTPDMEDGWKGYLNYVNPLFWLGLKETWTRGNVEETLRNAFIRLDKNICQTPVALLPTLPSSPTKAKADSPSPSQLFVALAEPANSGACALTALIDSDKQDVYVALAGDCRAVAGWQTREGLWKCDVLTEDQMGENPREVERMKKEHPGEEDTVIRGGRIQGGLQPTRAFGDAVYKWTNRQAAAIADVFRAEGKKPRPQRPNTLTPPYCTASPEITHRNLHPANGDQLKFIIMATDGLWDRITSEESVLLLSSYLSHPTHPDISKASLPQQFQLTPPLPAEQRLYPAETLPGGGERNKGGWVYEGDVNAATHLIRNSLAGDDRDWRNKLLSTNGKVSRWLRDDVTVTVVLFGDSEKT
ncbi:pyruvate dehydrogenase phosphatase, partial [Tremellales sp. Uapishka_1]